MDCSSYIDKSVVTLILSNLNARQNDITGSVLSEQLINELIHVRELHFFKKNNNILFSKTAFVIKSFAPLVDCSSRKYPYSPYRRDLNFMGSGGLCKAKNLKEMYEA